MLHKIPFSMVSGYQTANSQIYRPIEKSSSIRGLFIIYDVSIDFFGTKGQADRVTHFRDLKYFSERISIYAGSYQTRFTQLSVEQSLVMATLRKIRVDTATSGIYTSLKVLFELYKVTYEVSCVFTRATRRDNICCT